MTMGDKIFLDKLKNINQEKYPNFIYFFFRPGDLVLVTSNTYLNRDSKKNIYIILQLSGPMNP